MTDEIADRRPSPREFVPTDEQRRMARVMSGFGIPQPDIAAHFGIDAKTLRKHFREELDRGMTEANLKVAQSLFNMATTGGNVAAAIFWMKARAGWREKPLPDEEADAKPTVVVYRWADSAAEAKEIAQQYAGDDTGQPIIDVEPE